MLNANLNISPVKAKTQNFLPLKYNPILWLSAIYSQFDLSYSVEDDAYYINSWKDLSVNNNHALQNIGAYRPVKNNGVEFDGTDDFLFINNFVDKLSLDNKITTIIIFKANEISDETHLISSYSAVNDRFLIALKTYRARCGLYDGTFNNFIASDNEITTNDIYMLACIWDKNNVLFYINNVLQTIVQSFGHNPSGILTYIGCQLGLYRFFSGLIYEILIIQDDLSDVELTQLYNYFTTIYSI